jgi:hypothetical protein
MKDSTNKTMNPTEITAQNERSKAIEMTRSVNGLAPINQYNASIERKRRRKAHESLIPLLSLLPIIPATNRPPKIIMKRKYEER